MKGWQVDLIMERDRLEINLQSHYGRLPEDLFERCNWSHRLYHMTKYIQSLDKEISSWNT